MCLEEFFYIYNIRDMKVLYIIRETFFNFVGESIGKVFCFSDFVFFRWSRAGGS